MLFFPAAQKLEKTIAFFSQASFTGVATGRAWNRPRWRPLAALAKAILTQDDDVHVHQMIPTRVRMMDCAFFVR